MAHSLVPPPSATSAISARTQQRCVSTTPRYNEQWNCHLNAAVQCDNRIARFHCRRVFIYGLIACGIGSLSAHGAKAAQRRPPPPPPEEKKDPNVSGLQAKVLASKKRKEAMKEEMAKLRERGKPVD